MSEILTANDHLEAALVARGVNPATAWQIVDRLDTDAIERTLEWYDSEAGRVGPGVLVAELRAGGRRPAPRSVLDQQHDYGQGIADWLRENFPQWNREQGNRTHTAAIAEVIRLHHRHGKGRLTKREHGPAIRAAVKRWEEQT